MFKKIFGSKGGGAVAPPSSTPASANRTINTIQGLKDSEETLEKRKELLEKRIEAELEKAREYTKQKKRPQALQCLKKKKLLQTEVDNLDNMIMRVAEQRMLVEGQRTTVEVVSALGNAAQSTKANLKVLENVDEVMDDIDEQNAQFSQIQDRMGESANVDNDEFEQLYADMEAEQLDAELLAPAPVPTTKVPHAPMPSVPTGLAAPKKKNQGELELEALEAEMAA
eukprot:gene29349-12434_t